MPIEKIENKLFSENRSSLTCNLEDLHAEEFRRRSKKLGHTTSSALRELVMDWLEEQRRNDKSDME